MLYRIYSGASIVTTIDEGDIEFPYTKEAMLTFKNEGTLPFLNVTISLQYGLSIQNFSSPDMIAEAKQIILGKPKKKYYELLMRKQGKCSDMANFPNRIIDVAFDADGWCRNLIENVAIRFNHISQNGNSRIYFSEAKFLAALAKDDNASAGTYANEIKYDIIYAGQEVDFWYKFKLKENMQGEVNPRIFNIVVKGEEDNA